MMYGIWYMLLIFIKQKKLYVCVYIYILDEHKLGGNYNLSQIDQFNHPTCTHPHDIIDLKVRHNHLNWLIEKHIMKMMELCRNLPRFRL